MTTLIPTLAVAFAAICVWLTVRIIDRRERWAKRTLAAVIGVPVLYVASFGPACWLVRNGLPEPVMVIYWPIVVAASTSEQTYVALIWYVELWAGPIVEVVPKPSV